MWVDDEYLVCSVVMTSYVVAVRMNLSSLLFRKLVQLRERERESFPLVNLLASIFLLKSLERLA